MPKLNQRLAYYDNGEIKVGKTTRKTFETDGLVSVVSFYEDGTRVEEPLPTPESALDQPLSNDRGHRLAQMRIKAILEPKSDGGLTPEDNEWLREHR